MRHAAAWWPLLMPALVTLCAVLPVQGHGAPAAGIKAAKPARSGAAPAAGLMHVVPPGQTLWTIAREHGVSVAALERVNRLASPARLRAGQRILIPLTAVGRHSQEPPSLADIVLRRPPEMPPVAIARPVPGPVASPFGPRGAAWHGGVDLKAERGTDVQAAAPGMVIASGRERAYGYVVKIWHFHDIMTVYAHNMKNMVKVGDWVEPGQVIATVGSSGRATAPHLHFEVRLNGRKYDPLYWLHQADVLEASAAPPGGGAAGR